MVENKKTEVAKKPSERDLIISEQHELNVQYKGLIQRKQQALAEMQKLDEEILKKIGAFQALKKVLEKLDTDKESLPQEQPMPEEDK